MPERAGLLQVKLVALLDLLAKSGKPRINLFL
jgi:hypothetical protein